MLQNKPRKITGGGDGRKTVHHVSCVTYVLRVFVVSFEIRCPILFLLLR